MTEVYDRLIAFLTARRAELANLEADGDPATLADTLIAKALIEIDIAQRDKRPPLNPVDPKRITDAQRRAIRAAELRALAGRVLTAVRPPPPTPVEIREMIVSAIHMHSLPMPDGDWTAAAERCLDDLALWPSIAEHVESKRRSLVGLMASLLEAKQPGRPTGPPKRGSTKRAASELLDDVLATLELETAEAVRKARQRAKKKGAKRA